MRLSKFRDLLDFYGGDLFEWPPALRAEALGLLKTSLEAQGALEEVRRMETALGEIPVPEPRPDAIDRVMARIQEHERLAAKAEQEQEKKAAKESAVFIGKTKRPFVLDILGELGGLIYRPALLFVSFTLFGLLVGIADKTLSGEDGLQSGLLFFMMNL